MENMRIHQANNPRNLLNQWKSLPNLWLSQNCAERTLKGNCRLFRDKGRDDTSVPGAFYQETVERSKSMDFAGECEIDLSLYDEEREFDLSKFDLYLSKDFTDVMNTSFSERSDLDSTEANQELEESFDAWTELQTSQLTRSNLTQSLASRMYSYENLDRVGKNLYKINKWFQRCSFDEQEDTREQSPNLKSTS